MPKRVSLFAITLLSLLVVCLTACKDDDYEYPPVKLEFMTAITSSAGKIAHVVTDDQRILAVATDRTNTKAKADTTYRIISNYQEHDNGEIELYALAQVLAPIPLTATAKECNGIIHTDPLSLMSISKGNDYLNLVLSIKMEDGKHLLHVVEESVELIGMDETQVHLLLYHDAGNDPMSYSRRAYMSIPVKHYTESQSRTTIYFSYYNLEGERVDCTPYYF